MSKSGISFIITLCVAILFLGLVDYVSSNVIGIDFASDAVKVAIVQPGTPLEIVTNFQSKRKTPVSITFYKGERMFGADSTALTARKPELSFTKLYRTLGRSVDHPLVQELTKQYFPYDIYSNETTTATTFKVDQVNYNSEELVAMMLSHVKEMTANFGGKKIKDCVITVPSSFTQHERNAVYTAAEIADLNVLTLIEENTAAALHYGIDRTFETPQTVLYYNLGAGSLQVTIANYSSYVIKEGGKNKSIANFEIIGKAWDSSLGGFNFDIALADLLAERFNAVWNTKKSGVGKDLKDFNGPMTRLRLEAAKVKEILSANMEYPVRSEQLHADVDLNTKVTRAQYEEACKELFPRLLLPIDRALAMANMTLADVTSVELLGGGVRMPKVKATLTEYFQSAPTPLEVGQHMNGDESMALGAAFRAANLSTAFRVRKVGISDVSTFGVSVRLDTLPSESDERKGGGIFSSLLGKKKIEEKKKGEDAEEWSKATSLYPSRSPVPSKQKTVAFQYDKDILCKIEYDEAADPFELPAGTSSLLAVYNITGIAEFSKEAKDKGALGTPKVALSFHLDQSGRVTLKEASVSVELPTPPEDVKEEDEEKKEEVVAEGEAASTEAEASTDSAADSESSTETEGSEEKKKEVKKDKKTRDKKKDSKRKEVKKDNTLRAVLVITPNRQVLSPAHWSVAQIEDSKAKLKVLQDVDDERKGKEAAMNELEGFIYKVKNRLMDDEEVLKAVSTEEQRQEVVDMANEAEEWLYDGGRDASSDGYKAKQEELNVKFAAIIKRYTEVGARDEKIKAYRKYLGDVKNAVSGWAEKKAHITDEEKNELLEKVTTAEKWLEGKLEAQASKTAFEEAAFEAAEVPKQLKVLALQFDKVSKKPKPAPVVVEKNETEADAATNETESETVRVEVESEATEEDVKVEEEVKVEESSDSTETDGEL